MNKSLYLILLIFLFSCTSNTIFEKPKDLIPKDSMSLLIQEMMIASSAKHIKNINQQKNINYMPFVSESYKIDSLRFQKSNLYYMSKIDLYEEILTDAKTSLQSRKDLFSKLKTALDSLRKDSISNIVNKERLLLSHKKDAIEHITNMIFPKIDTLKQKLLIDTVSEKPNF